MHSTGYWKVTQGLFVGALARGDAAILLRFPHKGYREKIWDHAAGAIIVQEAGAVITDASGTRCTDPSSSLSVFTTRPEGCIDAS